MQFLDVGETQRLTFTFKNLAGASANPTTATITITDPDGVTTTPAPTHDGTDGDYHYDLDPGKAGWWTYTWSGQGNGVDQTERFDLLVGLTVPQVGACEPWCTWSQVVAAVAPADVSSLSEEQRELVLDFATAILYGETGQRYPGLCRRTFSICDCGSFCCVPGYPYGNPAAADWQGWSGWSGWRGCGWRHCTGSADHVDLGDLRYPVIAARDVTVAGAVVPRASWRIDDWRYLIRTDGTAWPCCPDLTDPTAFKASLLYGRMPFQGGDQAAAALAGELAKFLTGGDCALPEGVTDIIRAGITYHITQAQQLLESGLSGVPATDRWLAAEKFSRIRPPGGHDPARDPSLLRAGTDRGGDR